MSSLNRDTGAAKASEIYALLSSSPKDAWREMQRGLKSHPRSERIQFVAGLVNISRGKKDVARKHFANAIKLGTPGPDAYNNLALLSAEANKSDLALDVLDRGDKRFADDLSLRICRIHVLRMFGHFDEALSVCEDLLGVYPEEAEVQLLRGVTFADSGKLLRAISELEGMIESHPRHPIALVNLGKYYALSNQSELALNVTRKAYVIAPGNPIVLENLAIRLRESGNFEEAETTFRALMEASPEAAPEAIRQLSDIVPMGSLPALRRQIEILPKELCPPAKRFHLAFARASIAKRSGDKQEYVSAVRQANSLAAKQRAYDGPADDVFHRSIRQAFEAEKPEICQAPKIPAKPIFIVGMPRSGTTLLERMLSSARGIIGLGEVALINRFVSSSIEAGHKLAPNLPSLRSNYAEFQTRVGTAKWTVDKMPANYAHIGWINKAFPEAQIIVLRRDVRAVALSVYEAYFDDPGQNFSFEEGRILQRMQIFEDTIADWRELGASFREVQYEDLVTNPEACLREICTHCGLEFAEEMLSPEANTGSIRTASSVQARSAVTSKSIARWKEVPDLLPKIFSGSARMPPRPRTSETENR